MNFDMKQIQEWVKNNQALAIGSLVSLIAIIVATWFLFHGMSVNTAATEELEGAKSQLSSLQSSDPYPNQANIDFLKKEEERVDKLKADFEKRFAAVPVPPETYTASGFKYELEAVVADLTKKAKDLSIQMPTNRVDFSFSFTAQRSNLRMDTNSLKIQAEQLAHVKYLCNTVMDSGISEFIRVRRAVGTTNDLLHVRNYLADYLPACQIITNTYSYIYPYEVVFKTSPEELAKLVNAFEQSPYGAIIKCIQVERASSEMNDELAGYQEVVNPMMGRYGRMGGMRGGAMGGMRGMPQQPIQQAAQEVDPNKAEVEKALPKVTTTVLKPTAIRVMMLVSFLRLKSDDEMTATASTAKSSESQGGVDIDGDGTLDVDDQNNPLPGASVNPDGTPVSK